MVLSRERKKGDGAGDKKNLWAWLELSGAIGMAFWWIFSDTMQIKPSSTRSWILFKKLFPQNVCFPFCDFFSFSNLLFFL